MSIEIKITDIARLTLEEIDSLYKYLLESAKPLQIQASFTPLHESCRTCDEEEIVPDAITELNGQAFRYGKPVKTRKKRTPKPVSETLDLPLDTPVLLPSVEESEITYDQLVSFVLENTRTRQLKFEQVMKVLSQFPEIPNLNELEKFPHLTNTVYKLLKGIVI